MTRTYTSDRRNARGRVPDPFPVHRLKRVDRPTIAIHEDQIARVDEREGGFQRALRGD